MNTQGYDVIVHKPYGKHHPFDQEPEERFPREPLAGSPVTLGVKTLASEKIDALWAEWISDVSNQPHRAEGICAERGSGHDLWRIELPAFQPRERVRYTIHARNADRQAQTAAFDFKTGYWATYSGAAILEQSDEEISLQFHSHGDATPVRLTITTREAGDIALHFSKAGEPASAPAKEAKHCSLDSLQVRLDASSGQLSLIDDQRKFEVYQCAPLRVLFSGEGALDRIEMSFRSPSGESFWGFGERYNALNQRGNSLRNRVVDQYKRQGKRTYYPVPFFISSRGYGLWLETDRDVLFDMAETDSNAWKINAEAGLEHSDLDLLFLPQGKPVDVIREFTRLTGRPKMPPAWVFGLWMSSNDWNSQAEVLRQFDLTHKYNIPATVLVIEAWADEVNFYIWNDAQYKLKAGGDAFKLSDFTFPKEGRWPDPKGMVDALHAKGTRLILWQNPTLKRCTPEENLDERQNHIDEQYLIDHRLCAMEEDGEPYRVLSGWFYGSLLPDFTDPKAIGWWVSQREYLVKEMGVDGFKTDGGEHIWSQTVQFSDGTTGRERCNSFPALYLGAYDRFLESIRGRDRFLFSRAGYTGAQNHPGHWAGDEDSNWDAFRSNMRAMLNMGLAGEPFVGWDMGGFGNEPPGAELYLRSAAVSAFCPIMQYHSEYNARLKPSRDRTPWNIQERSGDARVVPVFRKFAHLRMNLMPYILYAAWRSCQSGLPMMRPLAIEFPDDADATRDSYEYLFGDALLVAPVADEGKEEIEVHLPAGKWRDFWTDREYEGGQSIHLNVPLDSIAVFQREGSIVALNLDDKFELGSDVGNDPEEYRNLSLRIFPGAGCSCDLVRNQGDNIGHIEVKVDDSTGRIEIQIPSMDCPLELIVYTRKLQTVTLDGKPAQVAWSDEEQKVRLHLPSPNSEHRILVDQG